MSVERDERVGTLQYWRRSSAHEGYNIRSGELEFIERNPYPDLFMHGQNLPIDVIRLKMACSNCSLRDLCMPVGLTADELCQLDSLVDDRRHIERGASLYAAGSPFKALYAVRIGSFKTSVLVEDGREQVTGFHMLGGLAQGLGAAAARRRFQRGPLHWGDAASHRSCCTTPTRAVSTPAKTSNACFCAR